MNSLVKTFLTLAVATKYALAADAPHFRDLFSDTWVGHDALGRNLPAYSVVGPVKKDQRRVVGIFYVTWHSDANHKLKSPYTADVSRVLARDPKARLDARHPLWTQDMLHWGEPEAGYYLSKDEYVIRQDMSMLADAGVDVLIMDVTNAVRYWDEWAVVFALMQKMKAEGNRVPQFCFWAFNGPAITVAQDLHGKIYQPGKYNDLWFYWDGKPLLLYNGTPEVDSQGGQGIKHPNPHYEAAAKTDPRHPHYGDPDYTEEFYKDYTKAVRSFFTLRTMWWGSHEWAGRRFIGTEDNWSFGYALDEAKVKAMSPDELVSRHNGVKEEAAVTPAQHPWGSTTGKSWSRERGEPELNEYDLPKTAFVPWLGKTVAHPEGYGIYYQERWDEAIQANPQFLYLNDWNEWTAMKFNAGAGETYPFMRRQSPYRFIDQYNAEFNRCLQPMKGGYTDNYYMQTVQNIRRYKGVRPIPEAIGRRRIKIDGSFADWAGVEVEYRDTVGDTFHRDYDGYGGAHYTNDTGRNDLIASKVAVGRERIYFYAETKDALTSHTGANWMLLLIDADQNPDTGWHGYDFLINQRVVDDQTTTIQRFVPALGAPAPRRQPASPETSRRDPDAPREGEWQEVARLEMRYAGNALELAVPRKLLGLKGDPFTFDFHWCDNPADLKDPISLCTSGDSAPNRRFNYRCIWKQKAP